MKIYDELGNLLTNEQADLSKGYLVKTFRVKDSASPVDDITKFAYFDSDYEEVFVYYLNESELGHSAPTQLDLIESQATYTAMMTNTLLEV